MVGVAQQRDISSDQRVQSTEDTPNVQCSDRMVDIPDKRRRQGPTLRNRSIVETFDSQVVSPACERCMEVRAPTGGARRENWCEPIATDGQEDRGDATSGVELCGERGREEARCLSVKFECDTDSV